MLQRNALRQKTVEVDLRSAKEDHAQRFIQDWADANMEEEPFRFTTDEEVLLREEEIEKDSELPVDDKHPLLPADGSVTKPRLVNIFSKRMVARWNEARRACWKLIGSDANAFYYRFKGPFKDMLAFYSP
jgi:hypothetical protein